MKLPAGRYWIGDPCYMFPHNDEGIDGVTWENVCDILPFGPDFEGELVPGYGQCFIQNTAYGDGDYEAIRNGSVIDHIPVDAGLIGIFPDALVQCAVKSFLFEDGEPSYDVRKTYVMVEFKTTFEVTCYGGNFRFGDVFVNTDYMETEEENYE